MQRWIQNRARRGGREGGREGRREGGTSGGRMAVKKMELNLLRYVWE